MALRGRDAYHFDRIKLKFKSFSERLDSQGDGSELAHSTGLALHKLSCRCPNTMMRKQFETVAQRKDHLQLLVAEGL